MSVTEDDFATSRKWTLRVPSGASRLRDAFRQERTTTVKIDAVPV
jgi:hypothetical protein